RLQRRGVADRRELLGDARGAAAPGLESGLAPRTAQLADGGELSKRPRELTFGLGDLLLGGLVLHRFLGTLFRFQRLLLVKIVRTDRGVGEDRHDVGLDLEETAL